MIQKKINKLHLSSLTTITCPLCHKSINLITDQQTKETVCINCGAVMDGKLLDLDTVQKLSKIDTDFKVITDDLNNNNNNSYPNSLTCFDKYFATEIGKTNKDASGQQIDINMKNKINRLRTIETWSQMQNFKKRNLHNVLIQLQRLKDKLGLPDTVIEKAIYIYRKIQGRKLTNGTPAKIAITAALYIACREMEITRTLKEISEISNTDEKKSCRFYRKVIFELDLKVPQADPLKIIVKIANMCKTSEITKRYALKMMSDIVRKKLFNSKNPIGLAGAIIYLSSKKHSEHIIQYQVANATGVTLVTLRRSLRSLEDYLKQN